MVVRKYVGKKEILRKLAEKANSDEHIHNTLLYIESRHLTDMDILEIRQTDPVEMMGELQRYTHVKFITQHYTIESNPR